MGTLEDMEDENEALRVAVEARIAAAASSGGVQKSCKRCITVCQKPEEQEHLPGTVAFLGVLDELKALHLSKTHDYGDRQGGDALANIRHGAEMVNIEHWKSALVRAADKVQRLRTYCRVGRLVHEGVEDTLLDLAAYSVIALVLFRESNNP